MTMLHGHSTCREPENIHDLHCKELTDFVLQLEEIQRFNSYLSKEWLLLWPMAYTYHSNGGFVDDT